MDEKGSITYGLWNFFSIKEKFVDFTEKKERKGTVIFLNVIYNCL